MKKILFTLGLVIILGANLPVEANSFTDKFAVRNTIKTQDKYTKKYDLNGLSTLYAENFKNSDGLDKKSYFKLITDSWKTYPDITYKTKIKKISITDDNASVEVDETASSYTIQLEKDVNIYGKLSSKSNGIYYLKKIDNKWQFTGEKVLNEHSILKYGEAKFIDMSLEAPKTVKAGEYYTASLKVNTTDDTIVIASINRDKVTSSQTKPDEVYRKLPEDKILERMFTANKDGNNEYAIASVGLSQSRITSSNNLQVYMTGIAILMTRVNVEDINNGEKNQ